jgi:hypothetical protein
MRRLAFILLAFLLFVSCAPREDALSYQNGDILAECKINGKYNANIIKKEGFRALELTSGSVLGISFVCDNGVWHAFIDEVSIQIDNDSLGGIVAITSIFDLSESAITTATEGEVISFDMDSLTYTVTYNSLELPSNVTIEGDGLSIDIEILTIKKLSN